MDSHTRLISVKFAYPYMRCFSLKWVSLHMRGIYLKSVCLVLKHKMVYLRSHDEFSHVKGQSQTASSHSFEWSTNNRGHKASVICHKSLILMQCLTRCKSDTDNRIYRIDPFWLRFWKEVYSLTFNFIIISFFWIFMSS